MELVDRVANDNENGPYYTITARDTEQSQKGVVIVHAKFVAMAAFFQKDANFPPGPIAEAL